MAIVSLLSVKGAPGVTTSSALLASLWPRWVLLADCDPAGGDVRTGFLGGVSAEHDGLLGVALGARRGQASEELDRLVLRVPGGREDMRVLPGLSDPAQLSAVEPAWDAIAEAFVELEHRRPSAGIDVIADTGRISAVGAPVPIWRASDLVVLVLSPTLRAAAAARPAVGRLRALLGDHPGPASVLRLLVVGQSRQVLADDVAEALEVPLLAQLPHDPDTARLYSDGQPGGRRLGRFGLARAGGVAALSVWESVTARRTRLHGTETTVDEAGLDQARVLGDLR